MLERSNMSRVGLHGVCVTSSWIDQAVCIQEDAHMNEMDRFRFSVSWYLYKFRAWWRDAMALKAPPPPLR